MKFINNDAAVITERFVLGLRRAVFERLPCPIHLNREFIEERLKFYEMFISGGRESVLNGEGDVRPIIAHTMIAKPGPDGKPLFFIHHDYDSEANLKTYHLGLQRSIGRDETSYYHIRDNDGDYVETEVVCLEESVALASFNSMHAVELRSGGSVVYPPEVPVQGCIRALMREHIRGGYPLAILFIQAFPFEDLEVDFPAYPDDTRGWISIDGIKKLLTEQEITPTTFHLFETHSRTLADHIEAIVPITLNMIAAYNQKETK